jgi:hypothetical protein
MQIGATSTGDAYQQPDADGYLRFSASATGDFITFSVPIAEAGTFAVSGLVGKARDAGNYQLEVGTSQNGPFMAIMSQDMYSSSATPVRTAMTSGTFTASPGLYHLRFRVLGKNANATARRLRVSYVNIEKSP